MPWWTPAWTKAVNNGGLSGRLVGEISLDSSSFPASFIKHCMELWQFMSKRTGAEPHRMSWFPHMIDSQIKCFTILEHLSSFPVFVVLVVANGTLETANSPHRMIDLSWVFLIHAITVKQNSNRDVVPPGVSLA